MTILKTLTAGVASLALAVGLVAPTFAAELPFSPISFSIDANGDAFGSYTNPLGGGPAVGSLALSVGNITETGATFTAVIGNQNTDGLNTPQDVEITYSFNRGAATGTVTGTYVLTTPGGPTTATSVASVTGLTANTAYTIDSLSVKLTNPLDAWSVYNVTVDPGFTFTTKATVTGGDAPAALTAPGTGVGSTGSLVAIIAAATAVVSVAGIAVVRKFNKQ
jgi:hypothetical protein